MPTAKTVKTSCLLAIHRIYITPFAIANKRAHLLEGSQDQYADCWLLLLPHRVQQRPHFRAKALVKHGVGLVQHNVLHISEIEVALLGLLYNLLWSPHQNV